MDAPPLSKPANLGISHKVLVSTLFQTLVNFSAGQMLGEQAAYEGCGYGKRTACSL
ncbi:hypothetical protein AWB72_03347 [Caballeronia concitans]|uniref:Uncharacterized protein n=1 Tax=Caballeronia concitans TaxID=1777133 RepID=A0A658QZP4_9BURK|nr:hypothetical protein AWB72_03347 [Caballeronia concitans]